MQPINFKEANTVFTKPVDMIDEECGSLHAYRGDGPSGHPIIIVKMQPIANGEGIYLHIYGTGMPPVYLSTSNPFVYEESQP